MDRTKFNYCVGAFGGRGGRNNALFEAALDRRLKAFLIEERGAFSPGVLFQVLKIIDKERIRILHTHEVRSDLIGFLCSRFRNVVLVATVHGWIANDAKGRFYKAADKALLHRFDHVVTVSGKLKQEAVNAGIPERKITVLPNALVLEQYARDPADKSFRRELAVPDDALFIGNIGRLSPEKGQRDFLLAASRVLKHFKDARFVLVGSGPELRNLQLLSKSLRIEHAVAFAGFRTDMIKVYNGLDLIIQTSATEGMPNVVLEALLMRLPVIATDVGGTAEIVIDRTTGILVPSGNPERVSSEILKFIKDSESLKRMAAKGHDHVCKKFNFKCRTQKLSYIYERLIHGRNRP